MESSFSFFGAKINYFSINFVPPFEGVGFMELASWKIYDKRKKHQGHCEKIPGIQASELP